jgi:hypothetical protein
MILHVVEATVCGTHRLKVLFNNGVQKTVDLTPLLTGPVFRPVKDPEYFARVVVDAEAGTIVWPNGADLAPEALYDLPSVSDRDARSA